jgi:hypothetical protein
MSIRTHQATYNIWGEQILLSGYIKGSHYSADYQPVTYLPTASMMLQMMQPYPAVSSGITLSPTLTAQQPAILQTSA